MSRRQHHRIKKFSAAIRGVGKALIGKPDPALNEGTTTMATKLFQPPHGSPAWFHDMASKAKAAGDVIAERITLTPELAAELLHNNADNRGFRLAKMTQLTSDIRAGRWVFNGEPILISSDGSLNDGQHRANAVVETNTPVDTMIIFGLDRSSRTTVDQGASRGAADYMEMEGVHNASLVAAIGRMLAAYQMADGKSLGDASRVSASEVLNRFRNDAAVAHAASFSATMHRYCRRFIAPTMIGFCHVILSRVDPTDADLFLRQVAMGENIKKSDPAFAVREGLFRERATRTEKAHIIFRGWNAYRQRRRLDLAKVVGNLPALV